MIDYVYDLAQLLDQPKLAPVTIIGHSLGGSIALTYTGHLSRDASRSSSRSKASARRPRMIATRAKQQSHERMHEWIETMRGLAGRSPRRYAHARRSVRRACRRRTRISPPSRRAT